MSRHVKATPESSSSNRNGTLKGLREAVRASIALLEPRDRRRWRLVIVAQVLTGLLDLVGVLLIGLLVVVSADAVEGNPPPEDISRILSSWGVDSLDPLTLALLLGTLAAIFFVAKSALYALLLHRVYRFLAGRQEALSAKLTMELFSSPPPLVESRSTQQTAYAITLGAYAATTSLLSAYAVLLSEVFLLVLLGGALFVLDPLTTLVAVTYFTGVAVLVQIGLRHRSASQGRQMASAMVAANLEVQEGMAAYRELVVLGRALNYAAGIREALASGANARAASSYIGQLPRLVFESALIVGALGLTLWKLTAGAPVAAVATLGLFLAAGSRITPSLLRLSGQLLVIRSSAAQAQETYELAAELQRAVQAEPDQVVGASALNQPDGHPGFVGSVELNDVWFSFPGRDTSAISGVSLRIPEGTSVAVVGTTGAGKSTLANLILGLELPQQGSVLISGKSPTEAVGRWPGAIGYVPQSIAVLNASVRENVALGMTASEIADVAVLEALKRVGLLEFIMEARDGLETLMGERGMRFSGGQLQRLGLARALYTKPRLLVLDEATSALDAETEASIAETVAAMAGEVTTITIAHRLTSIRTAQLVIHLEEGRIVASGSFSEVRDGSKLFDRQARLMGIDR